MDAEYQYRLTSEHAHRASDKNAHSERFIPVRNEDQQLLYEVGGPTEDDSPYEQILKNELLTSPPPKSIFQYQVPKSPHESAFMKSPMGTQSHKLFSSTKRKTRKISRTPFKMLQAPAIQDDFYTKLVDWSSKNVLAVGLSSSVYLWNATTNKVSKLCEIPNDEAITSVKWIQRGTHLAIGSYLGSIEIWDVNCKKKIRTYNNHTTRVGALDWSSHILTSGSRDRSIYHRDVRCADQFTTHLKSSNGHKQEVCGIEWSPDGRLLASGGNDNQLLVWDRRASVPLYRYTDHTAAVKAITWSPHQRGLLASGGGTADRCIRFRNTINGSTISHIDTGSQVCNLSWSKNVNEIVSTHGYSQNQIVVWNYPNMTPLATLTGHTSRVLFLSVSPDGTTVVTGAGDQTLRFWNIFPPKDGNPSALNQLGDRLEIR